mgnify:CR=1 FL=1
MNKEYIISSEDKVVVETDKGLVVTDNCDNIGRKLVQENLLEIIENEIGKLQKEIISTEENKNSHKRATITGPLSIIGGILAISIMFGLGATSFEAVMFMFKWFSFFSIPIVVVEIFEHRSKYKKFLKKEKGLISKLNYLEKTFEIEKGKLKELSKEKEKADIIESEMNKVKRVNDKKVLQDLKNELSLYYNCGYYEDMYRAYYETGVLREKLNLQYSNEGLDKIEHYLEETKEEPIQKTMGKK